MKTLKLDHTSVAKVLSGHTASTWRIYDDKDLSVNDEVELIDKVDPHSPNTWRPFSYVVIDTVVEKRISSMTDAEMKNHEPSFANDEELLKYYRQRYGPEINGDTPIKIVYFTLRSRDEHLLIASKSARITTAKLYADGGSRGNPGPSASGFAIMDANGSIVVKKGMYLGVTTNNQAEYQALKFGLDEAFRLGVRDIDVYMDSLLVVNQMKGIFKVKNRDLWPIRESIKMLATKFTKITFTHVPRELNKIADGAVNQALDDAIMSG